MSPSPRARRGRAASRALALAALSALGVWLGAGARPVRAEGEGRTLAVVVDRAASLRYADPDGNARAALAFGLALAAGPQDQIVVTAPALDPPVGGAANDLAGLAGALRTIVRPPAEAGGADLVPVFAQALERADPRGALVVYTADELDVVDAEGHAPAAALDAARQKAPRPDRTAVNEAARDALREALAPLRDGKRLFGVRAPLPAEARTVPFLESVGARSVDLDPASPLAAARGLAALLGRSDLPLAPGELALEGGTGRLDVASGIRVALLARGPIAVRAASAIGLDPDRRWWLVDADGPFEVTGDAGEKVAWLAAPRTPLALDVHAWRLASGAVQVDVRPSEANGALALSARAGTSSQGGAAVELAKNEGAAGSFGGRLAAGPEAKSASVEAHLGSLVLPPVEAPIVRAALQLGPGGDSALVAGAPVQLVARSAVPLPAALLAPTLAVTLTAGGGDVTVELARAGDGYEGTARFPQAGKFRLASPAAGELALEISGGELAIAPAPTLLVKRLGEAGPVVVHDGRASLEVEVSLVPAPGSPAPLGASLAGLEGATAELSAGASAGSTPSRVTVFLGAKPEKPSPVAVELEARLPRGVVARAKVPVELRPPVAWTRWAALAVTVVALLWGVIAYQRKRALARLWGEKQLRGLGPSGKITPERYLLQQTLVSRRSAVVTVGRTSVVIDVAKDGAASAHAPEGVELLKLEKGSKRGGALDLVHGMAFAALRDPSIRRFVYLEREPTAEEIGRRWVPEARSFTAEEQEQHSDLYVLLEEGENVAAASERLLGGKSARIGNSARVGKGSERIEGSDRLRIDRSQIRGESARVRPGDSARMPEELDPSSEEDEPIVVVSDEGKILKDQEVVVLDPGSSDATTDDELDPVARGSGWSDRTGSSDETGSGEAGGNGSGDELSNAGSSDEIEPIVDPGSSDTLTSGDETVSSDEERVIPSSDAGAVPPAQDGHD